MKGVDGVHIKIQVVHGGDAGDCPCITDRVGKVEGVEEIKEIDGRESESESESGE